jgi:hypothetical protein
LKLRGNTLVKLYRCNKVVGFPYFLQKQGGTYSTSIYDFRTWINDILIDHENNKIEFNESGLNERIIDYIFTKNVFFPSNEITKTKVNYKAKYGQAAPSYLIASYLYGSGKPWLNTIGKMVIIIKNNLTREWRNWIYELNMKNIEPSKYTYWENGTIKIQLENIDPTDYNDLIEIYIGPPLWDIGPTVFKPERFRYRNSIIPIKAIKYFSKSQLRLLRNLYYAFYGYNFKDEELKSFYKNDMSSDWYEIKTDFNEDMITEIERENIKIITEEEKLR